MEIELIKQIIDVSRFNISSSFLIYTSGKKVSLATFDGAVFADYEDIEKISTPNHIFDDGIACQNISNSTKALIYTGTKFVVIDSPLTSPCYSPVHKEFFFKKEYATKATIDGKVRWNANNTSWFSIPHESKNYFFHRLKLKQLIALNNETGEELWDYTLPETYTTSHPTDPDRPAKIQKILGIYNDVLWIVIDNGYAIGIQAKSGEQIASIEQPDQFADGFSLDIFPRDKKQVRGFLGINTRLDINQGVIFNIGGPAYSEIDLNHSNYSYTMWDINETLKIQPSASDIYPFSVTNVGSWSGNIISVFDKSDSRCFGQFDRVTKQIIWSHIFDDGSENCGGIHDLKAINNYIYVHARSDKSLYIYKLESKIL